MLLEQRGGVLVHQRLEQRPRLLVVAPSRAVLGHAVCRLRLRSRPLLSAGKDTSTSQLVLHPADLFARTNAAARCACEVLHSMQVQPAAVPLSAGGGTKPSQPPAPQR